MPEHSKNFYKVKNYYDHAQRLYKMFEEYYVKQSASYNNNPPEYITGIRKEIVEMVTEKTTEVKYLHDMFKKQGGILCGNQV